MKDILETMRDISHKEQLKRITKFDGDYYYWKGFYDAVVYISEKFTEKSLGRGK